MKSKRISVIVPVYNSEKYLDKCITSICKQTHSNLQIILVDDGSEDESYKICNTYAKKDPRIELYRKVNGGAASARNLGLKKAIGDYIGFVDSDDTIQEDMYEVLLGNMIKYNVEVSMCGIRDIKGNNIVENFGTYNYNKLYNEKELKQEFFYRKNCICGGVPPKLFKKSVIKDIQFKEGYIIEDFLYLANIYRKKVSAFYDSRPLYNYIHYGKSVTSNNLRKIKDAIIICEEILNVYRPDNEYIKNIFRFFFNYDAYIYKLEEGIIDDKLEIPKGYFKDKNISITKKLRVYISIKFPKIYTSLKKKIKKI